MTEPKVLVREGGARSRSLPPSTDQAWRWIGWFGFLLTAVGLADFALAWYPTALGTPEWEFGTVAASFSGLPLVTMGLAGMVGSAFARGSRWLLWVMAVGLGLFGAVLVGALLLFLTVVPVALQSVEGVVVLGIQKAVAKTVFLGTVFPIAYFVVAVAAVRRLRLRGA